MTTLVPNHAARAVMATWLPDTIDQARAAFDRGAGWRVHGSDLLLDAADMTRITKLDLPLWVKLESGQIVCIRAKRAA